MTLLVYRTQPKVSKKTKNRSAKVVLLTRTLINAGGCSKIWRFLTKR